jgi:diguanylate cyclase (GGDEF)-like protein
MKVLIAHGSAATRRRLARPLRAAGHEVLEAGGAGQALDRCRAERPDVLVVAQELCDRDDVAVIDAVKGDGDIFRTAIIVLVGAEFADRDAADDVRRGAQDFLVEPVRDWELLPRVLAAARTKSLQEELVEQTRRLEHQLFQDPLTRLYNRRFLFAQLGSMVSGARRHGRPMAVVLVDLDAFKAVNDRHGHLVGDAVLTAAAGALSGAVRAEDVVGRFGGEEFMVLLPDTDENAAAATAERLRLSIQGMIVPVPVPVTASVGWAVLGHGEASDDLVRRADAALYTAKEAGRNRARGAAVATLPDRT